VSPPAPADTVLDLARSDRLGAEYPQVRALLQELDAEGRLRAGRLLSRLDPDAVTAAHPGTAVIDVAITGHGTLSGLLPPLTAELARHGLLLRPHLTSFDSWVFELSDPGSELYSANPDLALCVLDPMVVFDEVPVPWQPADVERVLADKLTLIENLARTFQGAASSTLVLNTLPLPRRFSAQLIGSLSRTELGVLWRRANIRLLELAQSFSSVFVIDLDPLIGEGLPVADPRLSAYAKAHLSEQLLSAYAREVAHLGRHVAGRTKKVLALDLDETLWGGVLSDDGPDGIELGDSYRGEAFEAFQRVVRQIGSQGVLLAAVSKNDAEPVQQVLTKHPRMQLRPEHFVQVTANWDPKHNNLLDQASALNLGIDSFVFADDSSFECGLVRRELPEVAVIRLDEDPALHIGRLLADGWFDVREITAQDQSRTAQYRSDLERRGLRRASGSIEEYLRELDIRLDLSTVRAVDVSRVSQLTLRTNQFNLTTVRMQPPDVERCRADPGQQVLAIRTGDRFGENGVVGAVFTHRDGETLKITNFVLSCRVFSRGIEQACLGVLLRQARSEGIATVQGSYRPSAKNRMVAGFYPDNGFTALDAGAPGDFVHDLAEIPPLPDHLRLTTTLTTTLTGVPPAAGPGTSGGQR
jgi:FkbH-like protein